MVGLSPTPKPDTSFKHSTHSTQPWGDGYTRGRAPPMQSLDGACLGPGEGGGKPQTTAGASASKGAASTQPKPRSCPAGEPGAASQSLPEDSHGGPGLNLVYSLKPRDKPGLNGALLLSLPSPWSHFFKDTF